jgi:hypothetical protein
MIQEDLTLIALAEAIKMLREYREVSEVLLNRRRARYVRVGDRQRFTALNRKVEGMEEVLEQWTLQIQELK